MNIIKFIKNAWRFRRSLSKYRDGDYRSSFYLFRQSLERLKSHIEEVNKSADTVNDPGVASLNDFISCVDKIVKDKFMEDAAKLILKDKFDKKAFDKNRFAYLGGLDTETYQKIYETQRGMIEVTLKVMNNILNDRNAGLTSWYTL